MSPRLTDDDLVSTAAFLVRKADEADRERRSVCLRPEAARRVADAIIETLNRRGTRGAHSHD